MDEHTMPFTAGPKTVGAGSELSGGLDHAVFLVEKWEKHEGFSIEGVYASKEKADAVSRELVSKIDPKRLGQFEWIEVTEWPVEG